MYALNPLSLHESPEKFTGLNNRKHDNVLFVLTATLIDIATAVTSIISIAADLKSPQLEYPEICSGCSLQNTMEY